MSRSLSGAGCRTLLVSLLAVAWPQPGLARAEVRTLASVSRSTPVNIYGGVVIWSRYRGEGRYELVAWRNGRARPVPIQTRRVPFDADLGPDRNGRTVVVYSRCREEDFTTLTPRGCRLYAFDFHTRKERRVRGTSRDRFSETTPAIWRDKVVFARYRDPERREAPVTDSIHARSDGGRRWRVSGGTQSGGSAGDPDAGTNVMDLRGQTVAFDWGYTPDGCETETQPENRETPFATEIWTARLGARSRRVARGCSDAGTGVYEPSLGAYDLQFSRLTDGLIERVTAGRAGQERARRPLDPGTGSISSDERKTASTRRVAGSFQILLEDRR